jgi:hypothetical protein
MNEPLSQHGITATIGHNGSFPPSHSPTSHKPPRSRHPQNASIIWAHTAAQLICTVTVQTIGQLTAIAIAWPSPPKPHMLGQPPDTRSLSTWPVGRVSCRRASDHGDLVSMRSDVRLRSQQFSPLPGRSRCDVPRMCPVRTSLTLRRQPSAYGLGPTAATFRCDQARVS